MGATRPNSSVKQYRMISNIVTGDKNSARAIPKRLNSCGRGWVYGRNQFTTMRGPGRARQYPEQKAPSFFSLVLSEENICFAIILSNSVALRRPWENSWKLWELRANSIDADPLPLALPDQNGPPGGL